MKFLTALNYGECLENPVFWKKIQNLINLVSGSSAFIVIIFPSLKEYLTPDNITAFAGAIGALNVYFTQATSAQVGLNSLQ